MKGHEEKIKEQDYLAWLFNQYTLCAVSVAVERNLAGDKAKSKYMKQPLLQSIADGSEDNGCRESKEQVAVYEMKQRINLLRQQGLPESPM